MTRYPMFSVLLLVLTAFSVHAELQNVEVGGSIRIRGNYYNFDSLTDMSWIEQRTRLNVKADFTSEVSAFIEFDYYSGWGDDFRSNYLTGADFRSGGDDSVHLYQAYIEARDMWGVPLTARVGRQELSFGTEWLVGVNSAAAIFTGLSFDSLRLTYATDNFSLDAVASKLAENYGDFGEDDTDFYALYFSYTGMENLTLDAYWMYVRDEVVDSGGIADLPGNKADLHTIGLRGAGVIGAFDYDLEAAYQFGDVDGIPSACPYGFGKADVEYDSFGVNAAMGYTFEATWTPRIFARFAYFGGGDTEYLKGYTNDRELPFNRLFSNWEYTEFFANTDESNLIYYALGLDLAPTEAVTLQLVCGYFQVDEQVPSVGWWLGKKGSDKTLGLEVGLYGAYQYSEDLVVRAGYAHFFGQDGLAQNYYIFNGLGSLGAGKDEDWDYLFLETELSF